MSDPAAGFPAHLQLEFMNPTSASQLQIIFDTGLHCEFTLSQSDGCNAQQLWGQPQPETVRDYAVSVLINGQ